jgi:uncharacterized protein YebE (UPF0316 family)
MNLIYHCILAFISGIIIEALYALGVLFINERRGYLAGLLSIIWGISFLIGVNESFKTWIAALLWCIGLGVGTVLGVSLKSKWEGISP